MFFLLISIFESYESSLINIPYTLLRTHSVTNKKFHIKLYGTSYNSTNCRNYLGISMRRGNKRDNELNYAYYKNVFNFRLLTNLREIEFREAFVENKAFKIDLKNKIKSLLCNNRLKEILSKKENKFFNLFMKSVKANLHKLSSIKKILNDSKNICEESLQEFDVLFYIHGGGFISQTTESCAGYLSE
jgi:hypothetical protein